MNTFHKVNSTWKVIPLVVLTLAVASCDGSSYQRSSPPVIDPPTGGANNPPLPPVVPLDCDAISANMRPADIAFDALPGGIWDGTITDVARNRSSHVTALVAEDGRAKILYYPSDAVISTELHTRANEFTGDGLAFAASGDAWSDNSRVTEITTFGTVTERSSITGSWSTASGDGGCFELGRYYGFPYEETSAVQYLAGLWYGKPTLTVDQNGSFFGQDGCTWAGQFALVDDRYNMYEVLAELSGCNIAGSYRGLAYREYVFVPERALVLAIDNEQRAIRLWLDD